MSARRVVLRALSLLAAGGLVAASAPPAAAQAARPESRPRVVFLTHSAGFRHEVVTRPAPDLLAPAEAALVAAAAPEFDVTATQDCSAVAAARLDAFAAVVFYTTGELPVPVADREALVAWVARGGAFVGIHPATDTYYGFPAWADFVGAVFDGHPWDGPVGVLVDQPTHPSARGLGRRFEIADEIYMFRAWRPEPVRVVLRLDPANVGDPPRGRPDRDHPLAWARPYGLGRVFYTALGHRPEVWRDPRFLGHVVGGLRWAAGREPWTPEPPPGSVAVGDGFDPAGRTVSFHATVDLDLPDAADAAVAFDRDVVLRAADLRRALGGAPRPKTTTVDLRLRPRAEDAEAPPRLVVWIDGVLRPDVAAAACAPGAEAATTRPVAASRPASAPWRFTRRAAWNDPRVVLR